MNNLLMYLIEILIAMVVVVSCAIIISWLCNRTDEYVHQYNILASKYSDDLRNRYSSILKQQFDMYHSIYDHHISVTAISDLYVNIANSIIQLCKETSKSNDGGKLFIISCICAEFSECTELLKSMSTLGTEEIIIKRDRAIDSANIYANEVVNDYILYSDKLFESVKMKLLKINRLISWYPKNPIKMIVDKSEHVYPYSTISISEIFNYYNKWIDYFVINFSIFDKDRKIHNIREEAKNRYSKIYQKIVESFIYDLKHVRNIVVDIKNAKMRDDEEFREELKF